KTKEFLARFEAIDTTGFSEQDILNNKLSVRKLRESLDEAHFRNWEMPVNQMSGVHLQTAELISLLPFTNVKDYEDYISRVKLYPRLFDETIIQMRKGMAEGLMPPKFLLEKVATQAENIAKQEPEKSPFAYPLAQFPKDIPEAEQKRL